MTPADLRRAGEALYGVQWQTALARDLGIADRTVRRWAAGKIAIGPAMSMAINRLLSIRGLTPVGEPALHHVTLNTGHLLISARSEVLPQTRAWLTPMLRAGKGAPAGIPFEVTSRTDGTALFAIGSPPAVLCGVCWDDGRSEAAWRAMLALMREQGMMQAPAGPPPTPWLAVLVLPAMFALPPQTIVELGDYERSLAWCIIDDGESMS